MAAVVTTEHTPHSIPTDLDVVLTRIEQGVYAAVDFKALREGISALVGQYAFLETVAADRLRENERLVGIEEQLQSAEKLAEDRARYAHEQATHMGALQEQLQTAQDELEKQTASMSAVLTREVVAREKAEEQLQTAERDFEIVVEDRQRLREQLQTAEREVRRLREEWDGWQQQGLRAERELDEWKNEARQLQGTLDDLGKGRYDPECDCCREAQRLIQEAHERIK